LCIAIWLCIHPAANGQPGFRHSSIGVGLAAIRKLGQENGFSVDATEDAGAFTSKNLARYRAVVWLNTTGDVLDAAHKWAGAVNAYLACGSQCSNA
jgi:hypothetical protein